MSEPIHLTRSQAEGLYVARECGSMWYMRLRSQALSGLMNRLGQMGLVDNARAITPKGSEELALWIATHPKVTLDIKALAI